MVHAPSHHDPNLLYQSMHLGTGFSAGMKGVERSVQVTIELAFEATKNLSRSLALRRSPVSVLLGAGIVWQCPISSQRSTVIAVQSGRRLETPVSRASPRPGAEVLRLSTGPTGPSERSRCRTDLTQSWA